jgi:hypothetical protein
LSDLDTVGVNIYVPVIRRVHTNLEREAINQGNDSTEGFVEREAQADQDHHRQEEFRTVGSTKLEPSHRRTKAWARIGFSKQR